MLLLDTNILINIFLDKTDELPEDIRRLLGDREQFVSVATLWEMAIKSRLGKLDFGMTIEELPEAFVKGRITVLPVHMSHALHHVEPAPPTRDPFDRLLLAQCAVENMKLVTIDRALADHPLSATAQLSS